MEKELGEVAVEINSIFDNMSAEVLNKIPENIREFFKKNASVTYNFTYDKSKSLYEQNIKEKTLGTIAILYRDYICDENEKREYNRKYYEYVNKKEEEKRILYNPDNIFKKYDKENKELNKKVENTICLEKVDNEKGFIKRLFNKILNLFRK